MIRFEKYLIDPVLKSTFRLVLDDGGIWSAFFADGAELLSDTLEDLMEQISRHWCGIIAKTV